MTLCEIWEVVLFFTRLGRGGVGRGAEGFFCYALALPPPNIIKKKSVEHRLKCGGGGGVEFLL